MPRGALRRRRLGVDRQAIAASGPSRGAWAAIRLTGERNRPWRDSNGQNHASRGPLESERRNDSQALAPSLKVDRFSQLLNMTPLVRYLRLPRRGPRGNVVSDLKDLESPVEVTKRASRHLRGDLAEQLRAPEANVTEDAAQLLKFHGIYAQDNRDSRRERVQRGDAPEYIFMVRVAIPGGRLSPSQWLALDTVSSEVADGSIRLTTRQAVQFHGVAKTHLVALAGRISEELMTSFGACGDVVRNIVMCPGLHAENPAGRLAQMTAHLATTLKPASNAHWEIFVNGDRAVSAETEVERDFYGSTYLPRKFKVAIGHPNENCVDVYAQDLGLIPVEDEDLGAGFIVVAGGGLGRSYANSDTFARLGEPLTFATYDEIDELIRSVLVTYRELGGRVDRRRARMKYLISDLGITTFRHEVELRLGHALREARPIPTPVGVDDHLGWRELPDATHQVGIRIPAGRVKDYPSGPKYREAIRAIAQRFDVTFYITAAQDLLVSRIASEDRAEIAAILEAFGIKRTEELGPVERGALACPALPTCGQALAESERRLPDLVGLLENEMRSRSLTDRSLQLRMTGCPNGCARPAVAEIGVVGKTKSTYDLFLGGGERGDRLARLYREKVTIEQIPGLVAPLLDRWKHEGSPDESFGDFFHRAVES